MNPEALEFLMELYKEGRARRIALDTVVEDLAVNPPDWAKVARDCLLGVDDGSTDYAKETAADDGIAKRAVDLYHPGLGAGVGAGLGGIGGYMRYLGGRRGGDPSDWGGWLKNVLGGAALGGVGGGLFSKGLGALAGPEPTGNPEHDGWKYLNSLFPEEYAKFEPRKDVLKSTLGANVADAATGYLLGGGVGRALGREYRGAALLQGLRPFVSEYSPSGTKTFARGVVDFLTGASLTSPKKPTNLPNNAQNVPKTVPTAVQYIPSSRNFSSDWYDKLSPKDWKDVAPEALNSVKVQAVMSDGSVKTLRGLEAMKGVHDTRLASAAQRTAPGLKGKAVNLGKGVKNWAGGKGWMLRGLATLAAGALADETVRPDLRSWGSGVADSPGILWGQ